MGYGRRWLAVAAAATIFVCGCAVFPSGKATLERRRTTQDPLPSAIDVASVAAYLLAHGVQCSGAIVVPPGPVRDTSATHGSCTSGDSQLSIAVYQPGTKIPNPNGPTCSVGLTSSDGLKVVFEARGENFTIVAYPPSKSGAPDIWIAISERTTAVGQAAGLDLMEFTFRCK
jgi:hypothetical protein